MSATDGDTLTYSISSRHVESDATIFAFDRSTGQLRTKEALNHEAQEFYLLRVTVSDGRRGTASIDLTVTVTDVNEPPVKVGDIDDQLIKVGESPLKIDLSNKFHDPEGDTLSYTVSSDDTAAATVTETDGTLEIEPLSAGTAPDDGIATITVSASDPDGLSTTESHEFAVTVFNLRLRKINPLGPYLGELEWVVMSRDPANPIILKFVPSNNIANDYRFRAIVPHSAGLQVGSNICDWSNTTNTKSDWVTHPSFLVTVSCNIGTGNAKIELWMRKKDDDGDGFKAGESAEVEHPWHREYKTVTYSVDASTFPTRPDFIGEIREAAQVWTAANLGVAFKEYDSSTDSSNPGRNIDIRGYDRPDDEYSCKNRYASICVSLSGSYPHLKNDQKFSINKTKNWTTSWKVHNGNRTGRPYLPHALVHEFGHTLGLGHSGVVNDVMSPGTTYDENNPDRNFDDMCNSKCGLSQNDEDAVESLYSSSYPHTHPH